MNVLYRADSGTKEELEQELKSGYAVGISTYPIYRNNQLYFNSIDIQNSKYDDFFRIIGKTKKELLLNIHEPINSISIEFIRYLKIIMISFPDLIISNSNLETLKKIKESLPDIKTAVDFYDQLYYDFKTKKYSESNGIDKFSAANHEGFGVDCEIHSHTSREIIVPRSSQKTNLIFDWNKNDDRINGSIFTMINNIDNVYTSKIVVKKEMVKLLSVYNGR